MRVVLLEFIEVLTVLQASNRELSRNSSCGLVFDQSWIKSVVIRWQYRALAAGRIWEQRSSVRSARLLPNQWKTLFPGIKALSELPKLAQLLTLTSVWATRLAHKEVSFCRILAVLFLPRCRRGRRQPCSVVFAPTRAALLWFIYLLFHHRCWVRFRENSSAASLHCCNH